MARGKAPSNLFSHALFGVLLICSALVCITLAVQYEKKRLSDHLAQAVEMRQTDMARSLVLRDWVQVREIARTFFDAPRASVITTIVDGPTFYYPERSTNAAHGVTLQTPIKRYGLVLGNVEVCVPWVTFIAMVLCEPWLVLSILLLGMLTMGGVIWRLNRYRHDLQNTVATLRAWSRAPAQALPPEGDDAVAGAITALVREGVQRELAAAKAMHERHASEELVRQAAHTAHDIRGPVSALAVVLPSLEGVIKTS